MHIINVRLFLLQYGNFKFFCIKSNIYIDLRKVISFPKFRYTNKIIEKNPPDANIDQYVLHMELFRIPLYINHQIVFYVSSSSKSDHMVL